MSAAFVCKKRDMLTEKNLIAVRDNVFVTLAAVGLRQALLVLAGMLLPWALPRGAVETVAVGLLLAGVTAWGQYRSWKAKREALELAEDAPHGVVVRK
jgi:hypothetical protein